MVVVLCFCFESSMEEFGVKNEFEFVWFEGVVIFFSFLTLALCMAITWPLDLQIE